MAETERFKLTLRMDATVTIYDATGQATDWLKPGSEVSHTWKGMPTQEEVALRYNDMKEVCSATLEDVLATTQSRAQAVQRGH
jgi:hypothetical protein